MHLPSLAKSAVFHKFLRILARPTELNHQDQQGVQPCCQPFVIRVGFASLLS